MRTFVAFVLLISIVQQAVPARTLARSAAYDITSGRCVTTGMARTQLHGWFRSVLAVRAGGLTSSMFTLFRTHTMIPAGSGATQATSMPPIRTRKCASARGCHQHQQLKQPDAVCEQQQADAT